MISHSGVSNLHFSKVTKGMDQKTLNIQVIFLKVFCSSTAVAMTSDFAVTQEKSCGPVPSQSLHNVAHGKQPAELAPSLQSHPWDCLWHYRLSPLLWARQAEKDPPCFTGR